MPGAGGVRGQDIGPGRCLWAARDGLVGWPRRRHSRSRRCSSQARNFMILAVGLIRGHPLWLGNPGVQRPAQHRSGPGSGLGGELHLIRDGPPHGSGPGPQAHDFGRYSSRSISGAALGPWHRAQNTPSWQFSTRPAVPGVLALHPGGPGALLQEAGLIHHQHTVRRTPDAGRHRPARRPRTPSASQAARVQQPLHPVRRRIPGRLRPGSTRLAWPAVPAAPAHRRGPVNRGSTRKNRPAMNANRPPQAPRSTRQGHYLDLST